MGSKKLKPIIIKGTKSIETKNSSSFMNECKKCFKKIDISVGGNSLSRRGTIDKVNKNFLYQHEITKMRIGVKKYIKLQKKILKKHLR